MHVVERSSVGCAPPVPKKIVPSFYRIDSAITPDTSTFEVPLGMVFVLMI